MPPRSSQAIRCCELWLFALVVLALLPLSSFGGLALHGSHLAGSPHFLARVRTERGQTAGTVVPPVAARIEQALAHDEVDTVRTLVPRLLAESNVSPETLLRMGAELAQHNLFAEAATVFGKCAKENPALFEGYYNLALAQLALGRNTEALATIQKAPLASPDREVARTYLRGKIDLALGRKDQAEQDLTAAFTAAPKEENYALDLGLLFLIRQKYQAALNVFERAKGYHQDSVYLLLGLALAQYLGGESAESINTCRALLNLQPDFSPARVLLAFDLTITGDADEAVKVSALGLNDPAPFPYLYYIHAAALLKQQSPDYTGILTDLGRAERSIPGCALCYLAQSKAHQKMGRRDAAIVDLNEAIRLDPTLAECWYRLASLYEQEGRKAEAQQARQKFEDLKENKADRDSEMLRGVFLKTLGAQGSP